MLLSSAFSRPWKNFLWYIFLKTASDQQKKDEAINDNSNAVPHRDRMRAGRGKEEG
jgi:hypothetical protein